jgi:hypothetical protein
MRFVSTFGCVGLLASCAQGPLGNPNGLLTVVNTDPSVGTAYLNNEPCGDVKAISYYGTTEVSLRAVKAESSRSFFGGWEFQGLYGVSEFEIRGGIPWFPRRLRLSL